MSVAKAEPTPHKLEGALLKEFILAGKARLTVHSNSQLDARTTYEVKKAKDGNVYFVGFLCGPNNEEDYRYLGIISVPSLQFKLTAKSMAGRDSRAYKAFQYVWGCLMNNRPIEHVTVLHEGRCGKCGRVLTVPESIMRGIGPECAKGGL